MRQAIGAPLGLGSLAWSRLWWIGGHLQEGESGPETQCRQEVPALLSLLPCFLHPNSQTLLLAPPSFLDSEGERQVSPGWTSS